MPLPQRLHSLTAFGGKEDEFELEFMAINRKFPAFPFDPYPIQTEFMSFLYDSLDKGGISMLESPTGTGKTLSIICSALQWLIDQRTPRPAAPNPTADPDEEPDWLRDFTVPPAPPPRVRSRAPGKTNSLSIPKFPEKHISESQIVDEDREFLLEDYESEEEGSGGLKRKGAGCSGSSSSGDDSADNEEVSPKIFFASRTHSQLSQFVHELRRTEFAAEINVVCLGSRKNLCINSEVLKLGSANRINERCLELQKDRKDSRIKVQSGQGKVRRAKASSGCPMLRKQSLQKSLKNEARQHGALDMEDLVRLGNRIGTCPYYASRDMVREADLVVLPYQSLLLRSARDSLGLNLKNNVIVIDEAHNLADSLTSMYNSKITLSQLKQVLALLESYFGRFRNCLGPGNRRYIQTLMVITRSFLQFLGCRENSSTVSALETKVMSDEESLGDIAMTINEFLFSVDVDNINLVKLNRYVKESNIIHKVSGYGTKTAGLQNGSLQVESHSHGAEASVVSCFQALVDILFSLTNNDADGRVIVSRQHTCSGQVEDGYIKFVMLSGEKIFSEIIGQARAVVLAGGTLQPIEETRVRLFPGVLSDQVHFFTCSHIVPPESILPIAVPCGPSGLSFDFSFNARSSPNMIEELGRLLCNIVAVIPEGIVVFFSSFDYEGQVYDTWKASGTLQRIIKKKHIFREPRNNMDVEHVLKQYKEAICSSTISKDDPRPHGALLLAVVGGKISEGINFSDGMGRCVIMVGLPYPSPSDVELIERVKHIDGLGHSVSHRPSNNKSCIGSRVQSGFEILRSCKHKGREYYENLCMKAVNQSIGRAIRHINDYAAVLLVDSRYACNMSNRSFSHPTEKLPLWIKSRLLSNTKNYGEVHRLLHQFFQFNKQRRQL